MSEALLFLFIIPVALPIVIPLVPVLLAFSFLMKHIAHKNEETFRPRFLYYVLECLFTIVFTFALLKIVLAIFPDWILAQPGFTNTYLLVGVAVAYVLSLIFRLGLKAFDNYSSRGIATPPASNPSTPNTP